MSACSGGHPAWPGWFQHAVIGVKSLGQVSKATLRDYRHGDLSTRAPLGTKISRSLWHRHSLLHLCVVILWLGAAECLVAQEVLRTSPSRITLGGLSYGSKDGQILSRKVILSVQDPAAVFQITKVDLSQAKGIRLKKQTELPGKIELFFEIDTAAFTQGQPFGKFLKVPLRLETSLREFPQVVIPVVGWLSVNETERNFQDFRFQGSLRWQGPWGTPNMAGAVLVPFILLIVGGLGWGWQVFYGKSGQCPDLQSGPASSKVFRVMILGGLVVLGVIAGALLFLLGHTYSRGSWVALAVGLSVLVLKKGTMRWFSLGAAAFFFMIIFTLPAGVDRVGSYARVEADKSIANRFRLWSGALQAMGEHPLWGIGADQYGNVFRRDYQTFEHQAENSTAVSDFMTFGAERGLPFLGLSLGLLLFLLMEALCSRKPVPLVFGAMLASILAASAFSTLWFVKEYQGLFAFCVGGLLLLSAWRLWSSKDWKRSLRGLVKRGACFVLGTTLGLALVAWLALDQLPTRSRHFPAVEAVLENGWMVAPRALPTQGTILYVGEDKEDLPLLAQTTLRPLSSLGWRVVWPGPVATREQVDMWIQKLKKMYPDQPVYVAGHGKGGKMAWITVSLDQEIKGAGCGFLTEEFGQSLAGESPKTAFLVYQSLYDDQVSANASIRAQRGDAFVSVPLVVVLKPEVFSRFSKAWLEWIRAMNGHFSPTT